MHHKFKNAGSTSPGKDLDDDDVYDEYDDSLNLN